MPARAAAGRAAAAREWYFSDSLCRTDRTTVKAVREHVAHLDQSFRFIHFSTDVFRGRWHRHPQVELTWIEQGRGVRFVADSAAPFGPGDLVLLGPDVPHLWMGAPAADGSSSTATALQFPAELLAQPALPELRALQAVVAQADVGLAIEGAAREVITARLAPMRGMDALQRLAALIGVLGLVASHPGDLRPIGTHRTHRTQRNPREGGRPPAHDKRIHRVIDSVHQNLQRPLPVETAAAMAHVSPAAFSRFFKRETGRTYVDYVNEVRCSAACLRLRSTDKPVAVNAEECGFTTLSNFNRRFLQKVGTTPSRYRRAGLP